VLDPEPEALPLLPPVVPSSLPSADASPPAPMVALLAPPQFTTTSSAPRPPADVAHFK